jgi:hypothetical protein
MELLPRFLSNHSERLERLRNRVPPIVLVTWSAAHPSPGRER